jgi:hypothetical protein
MMTAIFMPGLMDIFNAGAITGPLIAFFTSAGTSTGGRVEEGSNRPDICHVDGNDRLSDSLPQGMLTVSAICCLGKNKITEREWRPVRILLYLMTELF